MASFNTLYKSVFNIKNTVIKNCNLYSDKNGVKHIRIQAGPNIWHENDCPEHGVYVAEVPWAYPGSRFTEDFDLTIAWFASYHKRSIGRLRLK